MADLDLVRSELAALVDRVVAEESGAEPGEPFGLYVFDGDHPGAELGRAVERSVFFESFGDTPALLRDEYAPYDGASRFLCLVDHRRRMPVGVVRLILPSPAGFKSLNDIEGTWGERPDVVLERGAQGLALDRTWDIATLAVVPEYRGRAASGLVTQGLYQGIFTLARLEGVSHCVTVLDVVVLRTIQWQFKKPFLHYAGIEPRRYLGSPLSTPVWCDILPWRRRLLAERVDLHDLLFRGSGLDAAIRLPDLISTRLDGLPVAAL